MKIFKKMPKNVQENINKYMEKLLAPKLNTYKRNTQNARTDFGNLVGSFLKFT